MKKTLFNKGDTCASRRERERDDYSDARVIDEETADDSAGEVSSRNARAFDLTTLFSSFLAERGEI